jgi:hypothetical protein
MHPHGSVLIFISVEPKDHYLSFPPKGGNKAEYVLPAFLPLEDIYPVPQHAESGGGYEALLPQPVHGEARALVQDKLILRDSLNAHGQEIEEIAVWTPRQK